MDQSDHDKIQRYLNNEMSSEEQATFDQSLKSNEGLAESLAFEIATRKAAKAKRLKAIDDAVEEYGIPKPSKSPFLKYAAMIALLILAGLAFYFWPSGDLQEIRKQNDEIALNDIMVKSKYDLDVAGFRIASLLNDKKYPEAAKEIKGFLDLKHNQKLNPCDYRTENFYLGSIYLYHLQKYDDAVAYLRCAEKNAKPDDWYFDEIGKHLTIAYIRLGAITDAKRMLKKHKLEIKDLESWDQKALQ